MKSADTAMGREKHNMVTLAFTIRMETALATPLHGETLFGQICWGIRHGYGDAQLADFLDGYVQGAPFLVCSDGFPSDYVPRPCWLPPPTNRQDDGTCQNSNRKLTKKQIWLPLSGCKQPIEQWVEQCRSDAETWKPSLRIQPRNSIDRRTGTTGDGGDGFAPYEVSQTWIHGDVTFYLVLDENRLSRDILMELLQQLGQSGFGKDANVGLGKFVVSSLVEATLPRQPQANTWLTLAATAPQGLGMDSKRSFYQTFVRFGRHGDRAALGEVPFKAPLLLARAGALLTPSPWDPGVLFVGQGLGGRQNPLSSVIPETVHQGYAPVIGIHLAVVEEQAA